MYSASFSTVLPAMASSSVFFHPMVSFLCETLRGLLVGTATLVLSGETAVKPFLQEHVPKITGFWDMLN
jgi:hypothetical protein